MIPSRSEGLFQRIRFQQGNEKVLLWGRFLVRSKLSVTDICVASPLEQSKTAAMILNHCCRQPLGEK